MKTLPNGSFLYRNSYAVSSDPATFTLERIGETAVTIILPDVPNFSVGGRTAEVVGITSDHAEVVFAIAGKDASDVLRRWLRTYTIATGATRDVLCPTNHYSFGYPVIVPGGPYVAYTDYELNTLELVSTIDGARRSLPLGAGGNPRGTAVSPDGKTVYVGRSASPYISAFDVPSGLEVATPLAGAGSAFEGGYQLRMPITPDGQYIAYVSSSLATAYVRRVSDGALMFSHYHAQNVRRVTFSADGAHLAVSRDDAVVRVYRTLDFTLVKTHAADPVHGPGPYAEFAGNDWLSTEADGNYSGIGAGYDSRMIDALSGVSVFTYAGKFAAAPPLPYAPAPFWTKRMRATEAP
ncbi:MAG TPA: WD40 repeat domain-containing protein [Pseudomonas sp.]